MYYHANTDRLLTVGHPFFEVRAQADDRIEVPKVSGNQYRVFRLRFPDPNKFAISDKNIYNPDKERLVWACKAVEIGRGQPLGVGSTGHPLFNKFKDTENPNQYNQPATDDRQNVSMDPKQTQMFIVGCTPCTGEHWDRAVACAGELTKRDDCPPIELVNTVIEDGNMCDIGFGAMNFKALQESKAGVPLDIVSTTCKYPDFLKMANDTYGDSLFFFAKREQLYARHLFVRAGVTGDTIPENQPNNMPSSFFFSSATDQAQRTMGPIAYFPTPSGSLVTSDAQLFNRPFWLQRAQGQNNGICWENQLFITVVDNTRNTNFTLSRSNTDIDENSTYSNQNFKQYLRHVEEYEISLILQLCIVPLEPDVLAHLQAMNPDILENWNLGFIPSTGATIEDKYRYLDSLATRCPDRNPPPERVDPYAKYKFWEVDLTERFSTELAQFSLGRKFLQQAGLQSVANRKRRTLTATVSGTRSAAKNSAKRRRKA